MNVQSLLAALPLSLHRNKLQLNCEINHTEVLGSDKDAATLLFLLKLQKQFSKVFLVGLLLLLQNHMASHETLIINAVAF